MSERDEITFQTFELAADAFDWLDEHQFEQGAAQATPGQLDFAHRDGRRAILFLPITQDGDQETEIKIFASSVSG